MANIDFEGYSVNTEGVDDNLDMSTAGMDEAAITASDSGVASTDTDAETVSDGSADAGTAVTAGMTSTAYSDPNKIKVTIADKKAPLVVLFGPPTCGKTMTLVRLTRYLKTKCYTVKPDTAFRSLQDPNYKAICDGFDNMIYSEDAARSTNKINYMLVKVYDKKGKILCQILEAPGEHYFNPGNPDADFPKYVHTIINSDNRKIWVIMLEPDNTNMNMDVETRMKYVSKIRDLKKNMKTHDKVIFLFNKIDETQQFVSGQGMVRYASVKRYIGDSYPGLFEPFKNGNPITQLWKPNNFDIVAFQTGSYLVAADGTSVFVPGADTYPAKLWKFILKAIKG